MNFFDLSIIHFINKFSQNSWVFDHALVFISGNNILKACVLVVLIWWLWFKEDERKPDAREHIIITVLSCFVAIILARALALLLPFRLRPLHDQSISFVLPYGMNTGILDGWSSFPSDHAVFCFTLSIGLLFISRKLGAIALFYTTLFIALPRVYLGLHYPTDIICGALIGIVIGWAGNQSVMKNKISRPVLYWARSKQSLFYSLFFFITYQMADMFDSSRAIIHACEELLTHLSRS